VAEYSNVHPTALIMLEFQSTTNTEADLDSNSVGVV